MLAITRKNEICDLIRQNKSVLVSELARRFEVTEETIRRDLKKLEDEGILTRVYGGAYNNSGVQNDVNVLLRENILVGEKKVIAGRSLPFINNGDSVFLDCSTTVLQLAGLLLERTITVVTNSLKIAQLMSTRSNIKLVLIGGALHSTSMSFLGDRANRALSEYYVDKAFVSCRSLSIQNGVSDSNENQAAIRRIALQRCNQAYLLVDHTKFGATSFIQIADIARLEAIITDRPVGAEWRQWLETNRVGLIES